MLPHPHPTHTASQCLFGSSSELPIVFEVCEQGVYSLLLHTNSVHHQTPDRTYPAPLQIPSGLTRAANNYIHSIVFQPVLLLIVVPKLPQARLRNCHLIESKGQQKPKCKSCMFFLLTTKPAMLPWKRSWFVTCSSETHVDCCLSSCYFLAVYKQFDWWLVSSCFWELTWNWFVCETFQSASLFFLV